MRNPKPRALLSEMVVWTFLNALASLERRRQPLPEFSQAEFERLSELRKRVHEGSVPR